MTNSMTYLLPGDIVPAEQLPQSQKKALTIGPGLQYRPPSTITATTSGALHSDSRKNALWLETNGVGRYVPAVGDLVLATVHHSSVDYYHLSISPYTSHASLPQLAFEGASKKTRPILSAGSLVYARVSLANKHMDPELECMHPNTGHAEGLGELKGGMVYEISLGLARRLLMSKPREQGGVAVLEELAEKGLRFEVAVGRNGKIWVNGEGVKTTLLVGVAVRQVDDQDLSLEQQVKLAAKLVRR